MLKDENEFSFTLANVTDSKENETRFIILSKNNMEYDISKKYKTSIAIMDVSNKPGVLFGILNEFSKRNINLTSIMSRPTKKGLGKYHFFIDINGHYPEEENIKQAIDTIRENSEIKVLGSYSVI